MGRPVNRRFVLVCGAVALAIAALGMWHLHADSSAANPRRVYDETGIIGANEVPLYESYLKWIFEESDVDVRLVLLRNLPNISIEDAAVDWMKRLGVGAHGREERGVLILYDLNGQRLRIELGYGLEEYLPDAFVGYLMNDHARLFFESGNVGAGLHLMLRILHKRIRHAILGERFDPTVLTMMRHSGPLSGGAGATAAIAYRRHSTEHGGSAVKSEDPTRYVPQNSPEQTYLRYLEWMAQGRFDPDVELFTPETRQYLKDFPMSKAYFNLILLGEYGKRYKIDVRGDLAFLYFTDTPFTSPHFLRQRNSRWYMDICAEVRNTCERVGGVYSWDYRGHDDDFSKMFSDKLIRIKGYVRIVDGDNRQLPTRRSVSNSSDRAGWTHLHFAAAQGRVEDAKRLLDGGEDVNVRNAKGRTPLYEAAKRGRLEVVTLLVERGATVNLQESDVGFTPLHVASERKHPEVVRYLIAKGADVNARNKWNQTPLWQAAWQAWHQDAEIAEILLQNGANPNASDHTGSTPLHMAASYGHVPLVLLLLQSGAEVDARTSRGSTPLHHAVQKNHLDVVKLLLDSHADVNATYQNQTSLHMAEDMRNDRVATLLRERGARN